jgi:hypothetical protein
MAAQDRDIPMTWREFGFSDHPITGSPDSCRISAMPELTFVIARDFGRYYLRVAEQIQSLVDPLTDEQFWRRPRAYGNSAGHLLLHLTGNLSYYIGAEIARTGYVRDRPREFSDPSHAPKAQVIKNFQEAIAMVVSTLDKQPASAWPSAYTAQGMEDAGDRFTAFLRCAAHLSHHAGQIIYLCKELELTASTAG